jgi:hypothetical protein
MDITKDITFHYISTLRRDSDELTLIVKGHLLIEFVLNEIIRRNLKQANVILDDHRSYTFGIKARVLFSTGLLPEHIFSNIRRINQIRNYLAHNLRTEAIKMDFRFTRFDDEKKGDVEVRDSKTGRRATSRRYVKMLCVGTLSQLRYHYFEKYGEYPVPNHDS